MVRLLLEYKVDVNVKDGVYGWTALLGSREWAWNGDVAATET